MLPKQPRGDNKCGAYCLAYYQYLNQYLNQYSMSQENVEIETVMKEAVEKADCKEIEDTIQPIYELVKFKKDDIDGMDKREGPKNWVDQFLEFSNPIRMMEWLKNKGWASTFYTGEWDSKGLVELIKGNWKGSYNVADHIEESKPLPTDQPGWFIAIWHNEDNDMPQHYVLYQRIQGRLIEYNPADGIYNPVDDIKPASWMTYHGAGIWIR